MNSQCENCSSTYPKCFNTSGRVSESWSMEGYSYLGNIWLQAFSYNNNLLITGLYRSFLVISACNLCFTICSHIMSSSGSVKLRQSPTIKAGISLNEINTCPHNTLVKLGYLKYIRSDLPVESKVTDCLTYIKCLCVCVCVCFWLTQWKRC